MATIIVSVTNDLVIDQRVHRICNSLFLQGHNITLVGRQHNSSKLLSRQYKTKRLKLLFNKGFLFYACYNFRLFFFLIFRNFDILLSNDLDTLPANFWVSKIRRKKIVFDSHEYFPEVPELINRKFVKNFWLRIERRIIPKLKYCYTVNKSIADLYKTKYGVEFKVIRNVPYSLNHQVVDDGKYKRKTVIYQGALNVGRGLDLLIDTMNLLPDYDLKIAGEGDISEELQERVSRNNLNKQIEFLGKIPLEKLNAITRKAHLGVSIEENLGLNYYYSLPNKLFDYIQANIPVLVSDLPEMKNIVKHYKVGEIVTERSPNNLANQIESILSDKEKYKNYSQNAIKAREELCWENEEKELLTIFNDVLE